MHTFFRRIRKGLLGDGATSKYLFYAVGEILLVMIGILLALQVNNWNEWRKSLEQGEGYIRSIHKNLQKDGVLINEHIDFFKLQEKGVYDALVVYEAQSKENIDSLAFIQNIILGAYSISVNRPKSTWDELVATGNTGMLQSDTLVNLLTNYFLNYDYRIQNFNQFPQEIRYELRRIINELNDLKSLESIQISPSGIPYQTNLSFINKLIGSKHVQKKLYSVKSTGTAQIRIWEELLNQDQSIISYMEESYADILSKE